MVIEGGDLDHRKSLVTYCQYNMMYPNMLHCVIIKIVFYN